MIISFLSFSFCNSFLQRIKVVPQYPVAWPTPNQFVATQVLECNLVQRKNRTVTLLMPPRIFPRSREFLGEFRRMSTDAPADCLVA
mmetsp:Transcript_28490/g.45919  ORF Transcript_28490/g.45919 Transcript_28490/m.45919 type:complete len:86 (+) Transcript_28490:2738-2995(+)